ncbi:MAG: FAD-dependent oxidoreductase [Firmicutes bacterium]|nr:FAD-dependent oxidoreductase [Bacillota bacterium]
MKKQMRCTICNEIFEEGMEKCPVCGVGQEFFVPVEVKETSVQKNTDQTYIILGGGASAISAAEEIRKRDDTGTILMVSDEPVLPYHRPMLTKMMLESCDPSSILIHPEAWYEEHRVIALLSKRVESIDPEEKKVWLSDGSWLKYDVCIYALGAECFVPDYEGNTLDGVMTIRKTKDVQRIRGMLSEGKRAAVIGAGVLGLEAAWELKRAGCETALIGHSDQIMGKQLDRDGSEWMKRVIRDAGVELYLGKKIDGLEGDGNNVTAVRLEDGSLVAADLVIISTGVRPNLGPAKTAGISISRAIVVDAAMKTSVNGIFACGDCAEFEGVNCAIWPEAVQQGKVAGANAAGESLAYQNEAYGVSFSGMGSQLFSIGDLGKRSDVEYRIVTTQNSTPFRYKKYWYVNDKLVGAILIGDVSDAASVTEAVRNR